jgi:hypothetical protein
MPKQTVPDIDFNKFVIAEIPKLNAEGKIFINKEYQRGDIWKAGLSVLMLLRQAYKLTLSKDNFTNWRDGLRFCATLRREFPEI